MAGADNIKGKGFDKNPQNINRKGRPKLPNINDIMAAVLGKENRAGITAMEQITEAMRKKAAKGDVRAAQFLADRAYGTPKQVVEATNTNLNGNLSPEQLDARIAQLMNKAGEEDTDDADNSGTGQ